MEFEIWCICRVLLVLGSRLKNEVYIRIHTCFPAFIFGVYFHCMLYMFVGTKMQAVTFTIIRCNCRMETLLVRSWINLSARRIERIGRIDKLARVIVINEMQFSDGEHNMSDRAYYFPFVESKKSKLFLLGRK